jgi:putative transposase
MTRLIQFTPGEYFHVYNRGTNKMEIFLSDYDYSRFQKLLYLANSKETPKFSDLNPQSPYPVWTTERGETLVDIGVYSLMPNHFHILIRSKNEKDTGLFLQRVLLSYSKYFNVKNERSGSLFQGKSKAEHVDKDTYLKYIYTYIHLNILKLIQSDWKEVGIKNTKKAKEYLAKYKYSSYMDYAGVKRPEGKILNKKAFPGYFQTPEQFEKEVSEFLDYGKN